MQQLATNIDNVRADLKRLSDDAKANSDKIAQAAALRSDLQDYKSSSDKTAQIMTDQIDALRSDQTKFLQEAKNTNDKAAQALRQELAASQAEAPRSVRRYAEGQHRPLRDPDATRRRDEKGYRRRKEDRDEDRQNVSNISPGLALVVALAALVLGPFVARQLTQPIAAARKQAESEAAAAERSQAAKIAHAEPPLAPSAAAELPQDDFPNTTRRRWAMKPAASRHANAHQKIEPELGKGLRSDPFLRNLPRGIAKAPALKPHERHVATRRRNGSA